MEDQRDTHRITQGPWVPVDPLGEALHLMRMSGVFYTLSEFTAPRGLAHPPITNCLMFHVTTSGRRWLEVDGAEPRLLQRGDLGFVPHGEGHRLVSEPGEAQLRTDVTNENASLPTGYVLRQNYPNPFKDFTTIAFETPKRESWAPPPLELQD